MSDFVRNGSITPDGRRVVDTLNRWVEEALKDPSPERFNSLAGHVKHWGVNVVSMRSIRPEQWLEEHSSAAESVLSVLTEADQKEVQEAQTTDLEKRLALLEGVVKQQAALLAEAARKNKKKPVTTKKDDASEADQETVADDEPDDDTPDPKN